MPALRSLSCLCSSCAEIEGKKIDATRYCGLEKYCILFSVVVGFNTLFYGLLEVVEEIFVPWKYFIKVLEVGF